MAPEPQKQLVIVLGASGKVGRMLRSIWHEKSVEDLDFAYVSRRETDLDDTYAWQPGKSARSLPQAQAIVALWGATPGSGNTFSDNIDLAVPVLELAQELGVRRILHCSSSAVYHPSKEPLVETAATTPPSEYGQAKQAMEKCIANWMSEHDADFSNAILRMANVAGGDSLFRNMKPGTTITLDRFPDGKGPSRSYIGPIELAQVIEALVRNSNIEGPINVAAPGTISMEDLAHAAGCGINWRPAPKDAINSVSLDTSLLQSILKLDKGTADPEYLIESAQIGGVWP